ncbi:MAG: hypothetical protein D6710_10640 [Nitrospirae bacterium]|nr:MAG: hypothetical protein D6710_10640 [Nitrospirota bacterium]
MFLSTITYIVLLIAYLRGIIYVVKVFGRKTRKEIYLEDNEEKRTTVLSICDVVLFRRLFRINKPLWFGEWLFHITFLLVVISHLRLLISGLPRWWHHFVCIGKYAGLLMPLSVFYILVVRVTVDWKRYLSPGNLLLISLIFCAGLSGVLLRHIFRVDIIAVKAYMTGLFVFKPSLFPESNILYLHYLTALAILLYLPSHVLTAPLSIREARKRELLRKATGLSELAK